MLLDQWRFVARRRRRCKKSIICVLVYLKHPIVQIRRSPIGRDWPGWQKLSPNGPESLSDNFEFIGMILSIWFSMLGENKNYPLNVYFIQSYGNICEHFRYQKVRSNCFTLDIFCFTFQDGVRSKNLVGHNLPLGGIGLTNLPKSGDRHAPLPPRPLDSPLCGVFAFVLLLFHRILSKMSCYS